MAEIVESTWRDQAVEAQRIFHESYPADQYDTYQPSDWDYIERRIAFHLFGAPSDVIESPPKNATPELIEKHRKCLLKGYTKDQKVKVGNIVDRLSEKFKGEVPVKFGCILLCYSTYEEPSTLCKDVLFRVSKLNECTGEFLIDREARVYLDWQFFLETNALPNSDICCPTNGVYSINCNNCLQLDYLPSANGYNLLRIVRQMDDLSGMITKEIAPWLAAGATTEITVDLITGVQLSVAIETGFGLFAIGVAVWCSAKSMLLAIDKIMHEQKLNPFTLEGYESWKQILSEVMNTAFNILGQILPCGNFVKVTINAVTEPAQKFLNLLKDLLVKSGVLQSLLDYVVQAVFGNRCLT